MINYHLNIFLRRVVFFTFFTLAIPIWLLGVFIINVLVDLEDWKNSVPDPAEAKKREAEKEAAYQSRIGQYL